MTLLRAQPGTDQATFGDRQWNIGPDCLVEIDDPAAIAPLLAEGGFSLVEPAPVAAAPAKGRGKVKVGAEPAKVRQPAGPGVRMVGFPHASLTVDGNTYDADGKGYLHIPGRYVHVAMSHNFRVPEAGE